MEPGHLEERVTTLDFRRATVTSFNALREDMNDRFSQVATSFTEIFGKLDTVAAGQQQIVELIQQVPLPVGADHAPGGDVR